VGDDIVFLLRYYEQLLVIRHCPFSPIAQQRGMRSDRKADTTWPGFLSPLELTEPLTPYVSLCLPPTEPFAHRVSGSSRQLDFRSH